jgi:hypothetical protein
MRFGRAGPGLGLAILALLFAAASPARGDETVDAAIVLAADVSRSIDDEEFDLQRRGYAAAIVSDKVIEAIRSGPHGAIALAYVEWAGEGEQAIVVDWTVLRNSTDAAKFAAALTASPRSFLDRKVIDVSGDGTSNQGRGVTEARDAALQAGAVINGLAIFNRRAAAQGGYLALHTNPPGGLAKYYHDNVIGGPGAFVVPIDDFGNFGDAMIRKLTAEIASRD